MAATLQLKMKLVVELLHRSSNRCYVQQIGKMRKKAKSPFSSNSFSYHHEIMLSLSFIAVDVYLKLTIKGWEICIALKTNRVLYIYNTSNETKSKVLIYRRGRSSQAAEILKIAAGSISSTSIISASEKIKQATCVF